MGLDMYLHANVYVSGYEHQKEAKKSQYKSIVSAVNLKGIADKNSPHVEVKVCVAYWRKANQIHRWFVENVQDGVDECLTYDVEREQLAKLRNLCDVVLASTQTKKGAVSQGQTITKDADGDIVVEHLTKEGEVIENATDAALLLPTQGGFFFGSTDYDEYYLEDVKYTRDRLTEILNFTKEDSHDVSFSYHSSW